MVMVGFQIILKRKICRYRVIQNLVTNIFLFYRRYGTVHRYRTGTVPTGIAFTLKTVSLSDQMSSRYNGIMTVPICKGAVSQSVSHCPRRGSTEIFVEPFEIECVTGVVKRQICQA